MASGRARQCQRARLFRTRPACVRVLFDEPARKAAGQTPGWTVTSQGCVRSWEDSLTRSVIEPAIAEDIRLALRIAAGAPRTSWAVAEAFRPLGSAASRAEYGTMPGLSGSRAHHPRACAGSAER